LPAISGEANVKGRAYFEGYQNVMIGGRFVIGQQNINMFVGGINLLTCEVAKTYYSICTASACFRKESIQRLPTPSYSVFVVRY
jgi:hypothetical protein